MKRMWIGISLLLVVLLIGIGLTAAFSALHQPLAEKMEQASRAALAEDWEKAETLVEEASAQWERIRHFTAAVADHEPMEEMSSLLAELQVLLTLREKEAFATGCARLAKLAEAMAESQAVVWWNLL